MTVEDSRSVAFVALGELQLHIHFLFELRLICTFLHQAVT